MSQHFSIIIVHMYIRRNVLVFTGIITTNGMSRESTVWLDYISYKTNVQIVRERRFGDYRVDGFIQSVPTEGLSFEGLENIPAYASVAIEYNG